MNSLSTGKFGCIFNEQFIVQANFGILNEQFIVKVSLGIFYGQFNVHTSSVYLKNHCTGKLGVRNVQFYCTDKFGYT